MLFLCFVDLRNGLTSGGFRPVCSPNGRVKVRVHVHCSDGVRALRPLSCCPAGDSQPIKAHDVVDSQRFQLRQWICKHRRTSELQNFWNFRISEVRNIQDFRELQNFVTSGALLVHRPGAREGSGGAGGLGTKGREETWRTWGRGGGGVDLGALGKEGRGQGSDLEYCGAEVRGLYFGGCYGP